MKRKENEMEDSLKVDGGYDVGKIRRIRGGLFLDLDGWMDGWV